MNKSELNYFRNMLVKQKNDILNEIKGLKEGGIDVSLKDSLGELSSYDNHPSDLGAETFERSKDIALKDNAKILLGKINYALDKLERGDYGKCEYCGKEISQERLKAVPYTRLCINCKNSEEKIKDRHPRPIEEEVISHPFGRTFTDYDNERPVMYDGEDVWQDVARYGTANSPQDIPGAHGYNDTVIDGDELRGIVDRMDEFIYEEDEESEETIEKSD